MTAALEPAPDIAARYAALAPVITSAFNLSELGRYVTSRYFNRWTDAEQDTYLALFERLIVTQHASNFASLSADAVEIGDSKLIDDSGEYEVRVVLQRNGDEGDATLDYQLRQDGSDWRIIKVTRMETSSELSALRSEFHGILSDGGLEALLTHLNEEIARCEAGPCYDGR